ncbi:Ochratoxin highly reducing polyketide synthase ota1 [Metarhizium acridum]|uniref:Ochratoxin highly reducing polyketide synthase ota1 n=1 Tax=Metarhizium acridum TaxID=92637 RepID=UPI001C6C526C|nr:Ochratoxin highly reducing polyketide synthase ota1 [Metarhizium acridum]
MSGAFFERAKSRFSDWSDVLRYQTFDVEKDPALQGFELASYDLIIATHVGGSDPNHCCPPSAQKHY